MASSNSKMGRPPKFETSEEMQTAIDEYFGEGGKAWVVIGNESQYAPTISGLANHLGMSTEALRNYENKDNFLATVKSAKQRVEIALEQRLYGNAVTGSIFNLKNNFGWRDKVETEHSGSIDYSAMTDDQLNEKIKALQNECKD